MSYQSQDGHRGTVYVTIPYNIRQLNVPLVPTEPALQSFYQNAGIVWTSLERIASNVGMQINRDGTAMISGCLDSKVTALQIQESLPTETITRMSGSAYIFELPLDETQAGEVIDALRKMKVEWHYDTSMFVFDDGGKSVRTFLDSLREE